jgi:hypothetical protein
VQAAVLGMLALLMGFTFSMAVTRYETRRDLVLQEANSIGTTFLRAALLPEAHKTAVEDILRHYVEARLEFYNAGHDQARIADAEKQTAKLQGDLWSHAAASGKEAPTVMTATFITALNDTIDLDATRWNALHSHVPGAVWILVLVVAGAGCFASAYGSGASGERSHFANIMLPLLIAVVITIISDLDRPRHGFIGISQQPLLDLKASLSSPPP